MRLALILGVATFVVACGGRHKPGAIEPADRPLGGLTGQRVAVTPAFSLVVAPELNWSTKIGRSREFLRSLDTAIASALEDRGLKSRWVFPPELVQSYPRNPT